MKVLLISSNVTLSPYPVYPLGSSMVAAALRDAGHEVLQADLLERGSDLAALAAEVRAFQPGLVGISIRNIDNVNLLREEHYIRSVRDLVARIRQATDARILLGGAGFSLMPELILKEVGADFGVVGEGEVLAVAFAGDAARGVFPTEPILRASSRIDGKRIGSALYDERILAFYQQSGHIASVQTKRGCPYHCLYCTYPLLEGSALRRRDPQAVVDDILLLRDRHGARYLFFVDSVFNDDEGAYLEVIAEMERREVAIPWTAYFKPGGLDDAVVARMQRTGLAGAELGADAACDATLRGLGKSFTFAEVRETNALLVRHGVAASDFFMFGGPGETPDTVREGIANLVSLQDCVAMIFMGIRILPGTPLARLAIQEGLIQAEQPLLEPAYYLSPAVERGWLERTLTQAFAGVRHCVFPPDVMDSHVAAMHKTGAVGPLWELLLARRKRDRPRRISVSPPRPGA
ncbi:MAG: lipid biosynthesis B12-binding/radical SAM protein [Elusimicrobia bacterium GWA2_69_24]|nr:MAG: lipid biosynthesis B12-binding/radical SAM protein [Elusimicrobia bacterium GWA2_69_24]